MLVYTFALCLLLILDNSIVVKAGTVTQIKKLKNALDEFMWCCIKKGCPFTLEKRDIVCIYVKNGNKVDCKCDHTN